MRPIDRVWRLSDKGFAWAARQGFLRNWYHKERKTKSAYGLAGPGWDEHVEGTCGELALAEFLQIEWKGWVDRMAPDRGGPDLPHRIHVRTRSLLLPAKPAGLVPELYIWKREQQSADPFVLLRGTAPDFEIAGWFRANEVREEWWGCRNHKRKSNWAYWVPNDALLLVDDLILLVESERPARAAAPAPLPAKGDEELW